MLVDGLVLVNGPVPVAAELVLVGVEGLVVVADAGLVGGNVGGEGVEVVLLVGDTAKVLTEMVGGTKVTEGEVRT